MPAARNPNQINIVIAVDVIRALSEKTLKDNLYMMDNNPFNNGQQSTGQGTDYLTTSCMPGQVIQWVIQAIDLQTPVSIKSIRFLSGDEDQGAEKHLDNAEEDCISRRPELKVWTGVVPETLVSSQPYLYQLELQMGDGQNAIMSVNTASLKRILQPI
ncbi:MAG: hypothetical protein ACI9C4_001273 [Paraglaciecola sp.]|jgi:hypothetical protein